MGDSNIHNHKRCPLFLVGHAGGQLKGDLHMKAPDGTPMANAMLTVLHTLGRDDLKAFGDSTGALDLNGAGRTTGAAVRTSTERRVGPADRQTRRANMRMQR